VLLDVPVHVTAIGGEEAAAEPASEKKGRKSRKKDTGEVETADTTATAGEPAEQAAAE